MSKRSSQIANAVQKARYSMLFEYFLKNSQQVIVYTLLLAFLILLLSRFFVLPFYQEIAMGVAVITFFIAAFYLWCKRPSKKQSLDVLDEYFPDNLLRTVYSIEDVNTPLAQELIKRTEKKTTSAISEYKKRQKNLWDFKLIISSTAIIFGIAILSLFPSASQQLAKTFKEEKIMIAKVKKDISEIKKKAHSKETKNAIEKLQKDLKKSKTTEETLQALVKKQKELALKKQKLEEKKVSNGKGLSKEELEQLKDLRKTTTTLSKKVLQTQKALSQSGTSISPSLQLALNQSAQSNSSLAQSQNSSSPSNATNNTTSSNQSGDQNQSPLRSGNQNSQTQSNGQQSSSNNGSTNNGTNSNSGSSSGNSNGSGNGNQGKGTGIGSSGVGAGIGKGNRDLIAIPKRMGEKGKTTIDSGKLNGGSPQSIQESNNAKISRGSVRSYKEVVGNYKDSYMQTTERLQLPGELHQIVQQYFSTVEK